MEVCSHLRGRNAHKKKRASNQSWKNSPQSGLQELLTLTEVTAGRCLLHSTFWVSPNHTEFMGPEYRFKSSCLITNCSGPGNLDALCELPFKVAFLTLQSPFEPYKIIGQRQNEKGNHHLLELPQSLAGHLRE